MSADSYNVLLLTRGRLSQLVCKRVNQSNTTTMHLIVMIIQFNDDQKNGVVDDWFSINYQRKVATKTVFFAERPLSYNIIEQYV